MVSQALISGLESNKVGMGEMLLKLKLTGILLHSMLFSASTDKTVAVWDSETGERVKRLKGHTSFVNSCYPARRGPQLVCTGSDDGTVKVSVLYGEIV